MPAHPECPEEVSRLSDSAIQFCDVMMSVLAKHLETVLLPVWDLTQGLEDKTKPEEVTASPSWTWCGRTWCR